MKIGTVLVSSNDNPEYYRFYPYIKPIWEKLLGVRCVLIFVGSTLPAELEKYKNDIIMYEPIEGIHTAFIAQNVRMLYPAFLHPVSLSCSEEVVNTKEAKGEKEAKEAKEVVNTKEAEARGVMIADVDCIPMSRDYYIKQIEAISDDKFVNYSFDPNVYAVKEHNIPYSLAMPEVWKEIFKIDSIESIRTRLIEWNKENGEYHFDGKYRAKCVGFHFDQQTLYRYVETWKNTLEGKDRLVLFDLSKRKRLGRDDASKIGDPQFRKRIKENYYDDNFFLRPYQKKKRANDIIARLLLS